MKLLCKICLLSLTLSLTATSRGQQLHAALNFNASVPLGSGFRDYVSKTSFRGVQGSLLYDISSSFRVGLQAGYNDFYEKYPRQVYKASDGSDISTVLSNTLQSIPVLVKGEYSFLNSSWIKPYIGLGAGINFVNYDQFLGEFEYNKYYGKAAFSGDIGLLVPFRKTSHYGFRLSTSYNVMPFKEEGINNLNTWNVQAGVVLPLK